MLILRDAFLGVSRFDDFRERLGASRNVLNWRLAHLVIGSRELDQGLLALFATGRPWHRPSG